MAIFQRLSDSFWSYVSPSKTKATTPQTRGITTARTGSLQDVIRQNQSISRIARVDSWRVDSATAGSKRKQPHSPNTGAGRRRKIYKMEEGDMDYADCDEDGDIAMGDEERGEEQEYGHEELEVAGQHFAEEIEEEEEYEDGESNEEIEEEAEYADGDSTEEDEEGEEIYHADVDPNDESDASDEDIGELAANISNTHLRTRSRASSSTKGFYYDDDITDHDTTLVVSEAEYIPPRHKVINLPQEQFSRGVSTEELQAEGWCDDHITLVQKIAMRGFEPLLPVYWKWDFRYLPEVLLAQGDEAFVSSVKASHMRGIKALEKLFEVGGRVRECLLPGRNGNVTAELQSRKSVREYMKWADKDAHLDLRTALPILAIEAKPADTPADIIQENAERKMTRLYARYREAFRVRPSIETSPSSNSTSTDTAQPIPQIYAIIASHTLVALVAYRPDTPANEIRTVACFDMKDKDYDVWNTLALAIIVCHLRNVRVRVAEETGVGLKVPGMEEEVDDPDL